MKMKISCPKCGEEFDTIDEAIWHIPVCPKRKESK